MPLAPSDPGSPHQIVSEEMTSMQKPEDVEAVKLEADQKAGLARRTRRKTRTSPRAQMQVR